ncbi:MAG: hypothetical protein CMJ83_12065 [Planctomycetes bacterium]|nr:hypothetical protein [Planctomycetota bacterium]
MIGWYAAFCDECGMKVGEASAEGRAPDPTSREVNSVEKDLYKAHLRLIHRSIERTAKVKKECDRITRALTGCEANPRLPDNVKKVLGLSERLLDLEQDWEDLQHGYNRESESIEEEFLGRIDELEADLELSPHHQEAIDTEVTTLTRSLEESEESLRETGRFLDVVRSRQKSGVLGSGLGGASATVIGLIALLMAAGGAAYGILVARLPARELAGALVPAWIGICLVILSSRGRRL